MNISEKNKWTKIHQIISRKQCLWTVYEIKWINWRKKLVNSLPMFTSEIHQIKQTPATTLFGQSIIIQIQFISENIGKLLIFS